jgi:hypothetical protein
MRWVEHVACKGEERKVHKVSVGKPEEKRQRDYSEDQGVGTRMGSERILGRLAGGGLWIGFDWLTIGTVESHSECSYEPSGSCAEELINYYGKEIPIIGKNNLDIITE